MSLGVAFSGGGLKGVAYIGVIKALKELEVPIDYLSGTSSGSIFASLYSMEYSLEEMKSQVKKYYTIFTKINNKNILKAGFSYFTKGSAEIEGLISGENIEKLLKKIFKEKNITNINEIDLPCAIIAVDAITSRECVFLSKQVNLKNEEKNYIYDIPIATAIRSSMSFPGIFTPCSYENYYFIDGGTRNNLPVDILREMGAEKILALNFKLDEFSAKSDIFSILLRSADIFSINNIKNAREKADLALEIDISSASLLKIEDIDKAIESGYNTIMDNKNKILELLK